MPRRLRIGHDVTPPGAPGTPTVSPKSSSALDIAWTAANDTGGAGVSSYRVERATAVGGPFTQIGTVSAPTVTYADSGLSASTAYFYRVRAVDASNNVGPYSLVGSGTTQAGSGSVLAGANGFTSGDAWVQGSSITLAKSGGGLGTGPTIAVYDEFRGGTAGADKPLAATLGSWTRYGDNGVAPKYRAGGLDGSTCAEVSSALYLFGKSFAATGEIYQCYRMRTPISKWRNVKETWWFKDYSTATNDVCFAYPNPATDAGFFFGNSFGSHTMPGLNIGPNWDNSGWNTRQVWMKADSLAIGSPSTDYASHTTAAVFQEAQKRSDAAPAQAGLFNSSNGWNSINVCGYWDQNSGDSLVLFDDVYIATGANAAQRFVLTDSATWTSGRQLYVCPHTAWSDTGATLRVPYLASGQGLPGKHLWYFDANNSRTYCGSIS